MTRRQVIETVQHNLARRMAAEKLRINDVVVRTGVSRDTVRRILRAEDYMPSLDSLLLLANGLGISLIEILQPKDETR